MDGEVSKDMLKSLIERIERLEENKQDIMEDIKEVYKQAKLEGFDTKTMKEVIKLRKIDSEDRIMQEEMLDVYKNALGMNIGDPMAEIATPVNEDTESVEEELDEAI